MRLTPLALLLVVAPAPLLAQITTGEIAAVALRATYIAALPPLMSPAMIGRQLDGAQFAFRYGIREQDSVFTSAVAASAVFSIGMKSGVALTAGLVDADCFGCPPRVTAGVGGDMRVYEKSTVVRHGSDLTVALSGDAAWAQVPSEESAIGLSLGAPITLTLRGSGQEGVHFVSFLNPALGVGQVDLCPSGSPNCEDTGSRWLIGGGVGLWNPLVNISASLGVNYVFEDHSKPVYGITVIFGGR